MSDVETPVDWEQLDDAPAASAQMIAWYAPKTAALLRAGTD